MRADRRTHILQYYGALCPPAHTVKGDHGAETLLLPFRNVVLRVRWQSGIDHLLDARVVLEEEGDGVGVARRGLHSQMQRL